MNANIHIITNTLIYVYVEQRETFEQLPGPASTVQAKRLLPIYQKRYNCGSIEIAFLWLDVKKNRTGGENTGPDEKEDC